MAFTEELKLVIRRKSHFSCCLCHQLGIEIHHIIPQAEGGSDAEDNAAPLCPSCHEIYGANPQKRKFLKEARDFWYELCAQRYTVDPSILNDITKQLEETVSKADLEAAVERITTLIEKREGSSKELATVELPVKYWVVVLSALENMFNLVRKLTDELRNAGYNYNNENELPPELVTLIAGTIVSRGVIIDTLVENGAMIPEASSKGAKALKENVNQKAKELNISIQ